jgi:hypothetical protein
MILKVTFCRKIFNAIHSISLQTVLEYVYEVDFKTGPFSAQFLFKVWNQDNKYFYILNRVHYSGCFKHTNVHQKTHQLEKNFNGHRRLENLHWKNICNVSRKIRLSSKLSNWNLILEQTR